jgi:hypothetical protein
MGPKEKSVVGTPSPITQNEKDSRASYNMYDLSIHGSFLCLCKCCTVYSYISEVVDIVNCKHQ